VPGCFGRWERPVTGRSDMRFCTGSGVSSLRSACMRERNRQRYFAAAALKWLQQVLQKRECTQTEENRQD
jgi:hypothetical protein